ncbi:MAG: SGNH/GDSL hydrolase family protein [Clostridia bacterium]|nr:SGNH/GDSL hydrolase family protein [Clostridia bacterium]
MSKKKKSLKRRLKHFWARIKRRRKILIPILLIILIALILSVTISRNNSGKTMPDVDDSTVDEIIAEENREKLPMEGQVCVCFGDSITGNTEPPNDYPSVLARETGMKVINLGFGGSRMSVHPYPEYDAFSMYRLVDAIVTKNYDLQEANKTNEAIASVADKKLRSLKGIDWEEVDYITLCYGANDIQQWGNPIDNPDNPLDTSTFLGAYRYTIERIKLEYPHIKVIVMTPLYRYWEDSMETSDEQIIQDVPYTAWVDRVIEVAIEYNVHCIDLYKLPGFNKSNSNLYYQTDGVHPNHDGLRVVGKIISNEMIKQYVK